jgi:hypothetical protein
MQPTVFDRLPDLFTVGPRKPLGYECIAAIATIADPEVIASLLGFKGLQVRTHDETLYVYDEAALQRLLRRRWVVLTWHRWPHTAEEFVARVASEWAPQHTWLWNTVADAFGDYTNSARRGGGGW